MKTLLKRSFSTLSVSLILANGILAQQRSSFSGYVHCAESGEALLGATIDVTDCETGTITNHDGLYAVTLEKGACLVRYSYLGYDPVNIFSIMMANANTLLIRSTSMLNLAGDPFKESNKTKHR